MATDAFARAIRARLHEIVVEKGYSISGVALAMGKSNSWLARKLDGNRALLVDDVDLVCNFLEVQPPACR